MVIAHQNSDDIVRVGLHPVEDSDQIVLQSSNIEHVAARMTQIQLPVEHVYLELQHPDAVIQLRGHIQLLVGSDVARSHEGGIVSTNMRDIAIRSVAEFGVAITGGGIGRLC